MYKFDEVSKLSSNFNINLIDESGKFYIKSIPTPNYCSSENYDAVRKAKTENHKFDIDLTDSEYKNFVKRLIKNLNSNIDKSKFFSIDQELELSDENTERIYQDKFVAYNKATSKRIYVDIVQVNGKLTEKQRKTLAEDVSIKSKLEGQDNFTYFVIPIRAQLNISSSLKMVYKSKFTKSIYSLNETINNTPNSQKYKDLRGNIIEQLSGLYKLIPKPNISYAHFISYCGEIIELPVQRKENVLGKDKVYEYTLCYDNKLNNYASLVKTIEANLPSKKPNQMGGGIGANHTKHHGKSYLKAHEAKNALIDFRLKKPAEVFTHVNHGLLESSCFESSHITNSQEPKSVIFKYATWFVKNQKFGIPANFPADKYFTIGKNEVVYNNIKSLDMLGIVLMTFGLDLKE
jgi:hypothetical protein